MRFEYDPKEVSALLASISKGLGGLLQVLVV